MKYVITHSNGDQYGEVEATSAKAAIAKWVRQGGRAKRGLRAVRVVGGVVGGRRRPNPSLTKTQRKARTKKLSAKRRVANALKAYLQKANPGRKLAGAKVQKNKGSITIVPVFLKKRK